VLIIGVPEHDGAVLDGEVRLGNGPRVAVVIAVADRHPVTMERTWPEVSDVPLATVDCHGPNC